MEILKGLAALPLTIVTSVILIFLGIIYFIITLLIVKVSAEIVLGAGQAEANWILFSAGLITAASMLGAAIQRED
ncbi:MAG: hypothetical protein JW778_07400 [Candidatus Altiarchaeota archaeon]|nr:hypothetical protein [Candidatus Altiarchaeota archaeon]